MTWHIDVSKSFFINMDVFLIDCIVDFDIFFEALEVFLEAFNKGWSLFWLATLYERIHVQLGVDSICFQLIHCLCQAWLLFLS
jgi:hypothetical protein